MSVKPVSQMDRQEVSTYRLDLEHRLAEADERERYLDTIDPVRELAEALHNAQCHHNHTDMCGWFYEFDKKVPNWDGYAHAEYLKKAKALVAKLPDFSVEQILDVARALK